MNNVFTIIKKTRHPTIVCCDKKTSINYVLTVKYSSVVLVLANRIYHAQYTLIMDYTCLVCNYNAGNERLNDK